jgi:hypothetical protein
VVRTELNHQNLETTIIDVQKARGPLARHEARVFSTTRARHDTSYFGPGLSPTRRACRARQPSRPVGLARARPDIWWASNLARYKFQFPTQRPSHAVNHLGPFGNVLVINDNCLWTNDSWRNKNAGLDHIEQEMLKNHTHWLWIR